MLVPFSGPAFIHGDGSLTALKVEISNHDEMQKAPKYSPIFKDGNKVSCPKCHRKKSNNQILISPLSRVLWWLMGFSVCAPCDRGD